MKTLITALLLVCSASAMAASQSGITQHWSAYNKSSTATIDHSAFADFLQQYVVKRDNAPNLMQYDRISKKAHKRLEAYIHKLAGLSLAQYNRDVQLAYWINLYNAALIDLVLDHYPVEAVYQIGGASASPWAMTVVTIDGYPLSLNEIRHYIIDAIWGERLTDYGLSWAAVGGPELRAQPYSSDQIFLQLRNNSERFVNGPKGMTTKKDRLVVSRFFDWFRRDFGGSTEALISQLRQHAEPALSARLDIYDTIDGFTFDWRLNDAALLD